MKKFIVSVVASFMLLLSFDDASAASTATVTGTDGASLYCRTSYPSGSVITRLPAGSTVELRGEAENGWYPVICAGQNGWSSGTYLTVSGEAPAPADPTPAPTSPEPTGNVGTATVVNTGGQSLNCRSSAPSGAVIGSLAAGSSVTLRGDAVSGWYPVVCSGKNGWASGSYLSVGGGTTPAPAPADPTPAPAEPKAPADTSGSGTILTVVNTGGQGLNCRSSYPSGPVISTLWPGAKITARGSQENGWWPLTCGGKPGWASANYLSVSDASAPAPSEPSAPSSSGQAIADFGMKYVGYPYVWATAGPNSFDCSGFTNWVVKNVTGTDIGRGTGTQAALGTHVAWGQWQPGDLLFFTGTGGSGYYSHVAIYIGNGKMVHAENPTDDVNVDSVYSTYYTNHYAMARRLV